MKRQEYHEFLELADNFYNQENYKDALIYYKKALSNIGVDEELEQADLFLKMGNLYFNMGKYDTARDYYKNSLKIYSRKKNHHGKGYCYTGLGIIKEKHGDHDEARKYYGKAVKSFQKTGDREREAIVRSLIANTYETQGAWEDALDEYKKSCEKFEESGHDGHDDFLQINQNIQKKREKFGVSRKEIILAIIYFLGLTIAETLVTYFNLEIGLILETVILFALLVNSSLTTSSYNFSILLRSMMALPLIRIIGLSIPMMHIDSLYWFPIMSIPLFATSFTIMWSQGLSFKNVGFVWGNIPVQLAIAMTGIFLGTIEYMILQPKPLIGTFNMETLIFASIILIISTGLGEEILFRGIIQKNAMNVFGVASGLLYTALLFTTLHIGWNSLYDLIFVFLVGVFYGMAFYKTKSILGVTLSHGISNAFLFLVIPFYAPLVYSLIPF